MIPSGVEIFVGLTPIDLRLGFDRLAGLASEHMGRAARSGALFVFFGKRKSAMKILFFDGSRLCQFYKRFHKATFELPVPSDADSGMSVRIDGQKLAALLAGQPKTRKKKAKLRIVR
jgi:transposase